MIETRQKILDAAMVAFSRHGLTGATTRKIATLARVNEVTLFRYFKNKDGLLRCVVARYAEQYQLFFDQAVPDKETDLKHTIDSFTKLYVNMMREKEDFVRTFFGEMRRHPDLCRSLFVESFRKMRRRFIDYLRKARKNGLIRRDFDLIPAADALTGMLMAGVIRQPLTEDEYSVEHYRRNCVKLFLRAIQP